MLQSAALAAIRIYQRHISPRKGFSCAYRVHTGRAGCSELGYRAIRRFGLLGGLRVLNRRLQCCSQEHRRHTPAPHRPLRWQRGDCDIGCIEVPDLDCQSGRWSWAADCCGSGCDWPWRRDKEKVRKR